MRPVIDVETDAGIVQDVSREELHNPPDTSSHQPLKQFLNNVGLKAKPLGLRMLLSRRPLRILTEGVFNLGICSEKGGG